MATVSCLNCGNVYQGKFCPGCGQKATVSKLTWKTVIREFIHFFTHAEHSFIYTSKRLFTEPGAVMKDFLDGKRKLIHRPITFLLIWTAIDQVVLRFYSYCQKQFNLYEFPDSASALRILWKGARNPRIADYQTWATLLIQAPLLVLAGWLVFRKTRTSFVERWVIIVYGICATIMLSVIMRTVTFLLRLAHVPFSTGAFNDTYFICYQVLTTWIVYSFLKTYRPQMPQYLKFMLSFFAALLGNYASDLSFYLLYRFSA